MKPSLFFLSCCLLALITAACSSGNGWRQASRESAGIAPDPATTKEAVLHVYGADAWGGAAGLRSIPGLPTTFRSSACGCRFPRSAAAMPAGNRALKRSTWTTISLMACRD